MKIINTNTNETVHEIITNRSFTLDEASIAFAGEYSNDAAINGEPEVTIDDKQYYYDEPRACRYSKNKMTGQRDFSPARSF